jgi:hypothetical protein
METHTINPVHPGGGSSAMNMIPFRSFSMTVLLGLLLTAGQGCGRQEAPTSEPPPAAPEPVQAESPVPSAPQAAAPPVVREPETSPYGFYTLQVSSWRTSARAQTEAARLRARGLEAYVTEADLGARGTWYRVRVGRYAGVSEARRAAQALVEIPEGAWVDNYRDPPNPPR